ncbi:MAG: RsmB/NOP family class I SAM-dependent RNA methyltransferase, partial [Acidobacteriia bacterium]|nr:RsmB/NOP family class I SAM-dependent RNA methyltransferase [Terriglobia bacterium]
FLAEPEHYLRVPLGSEEEALSLGARPSAEPGCFLMGSRGPGRFRRQDIGSQAVVPMLDLQPGQRFLDVCAAPGNKTAQALESGVRAVACDLHENRLRDLRVLQCSLVVADGTQPLPFCGGFDRILVDAPCSGTGTLGRNPDIRWRVQAADVVDLHQRQVRILRNALEQLAPSGRLVYATCSLESEENEGVVNEVLAGAGGQFRLTGQMQRLPGRDAGDGFYAAVLTS